MAGPLKKDRFFCSFPKTDREGRDERDRDIEIETGREGEWMGYIFVFMYRKKYNKAYNSCFIKGHPSLRKNNKKKSWQKLK